MRRSYTYEQNLKFERRRGWHLLGIAGVRDGLAYVYADRRGRRHKVVRKA